MNIKINRKELASTKNALKNEWMRKQLNIEIKTAEGSRYVDNVIKRKIKEYSLSSQNRRKFLMYCIRAQLENDYLLVSELIKLIGISRAGAETMIKECEEAKWIIVKRCKKHRRKIQASDITVETYQDYCSWLWKIINKTDMRSLSGSINEIEKLERTFS
ncbi:MarR family transcriptional regulator [Rhodobacteraceae bacterium]|nr:MarR family transcriptional regulator [Paracoccaceae bacterium]|tara:strand:+ start:686 stop:1165 length:480 start_codon:yes stop_codon:yes gene_type:complete